MDNQKTQAPHYCMYSDRSPVSRGVKDGFKGQMGRKLGQITKPFRCFQTPSL